MKISLMLGEKKYEIAKVKAEYEADNLHDLGTAILSNAWSPFIFQDAHPEAPEYKHRKASNMCYADVFAIDIDGGLKIEKAIERLQEGDIQAIIATTKSHQVEKNGSTNDRFRIIFPLKTPLISHLQVRPLFDKVIEMFPESDEACKDAARFYFPCTYIVYTKDQGERLSPAPVVKEKEQASSLTPVPVSNDNRRFPLSNKTLKFIKEGAPQGARNAPFTEACHDAIQQQWTEQEYFSFLADNGQDWMSSDVNREKIAERWKNFKPTHPPRIPSQGTSVGKAMRLPVNQVKLVLEKWLADNDVAVSYNRTLYIGKQNMIGPDIVRKVVLHLSYANFAVDEKLIEYNLMEWLEEKRLLHLEAVRDDLSSFNEKGGDVELKKFLSVFKSSVSDLDVAIHKHMMWQVKRKLNGFRTKYEMMLVWTGGQGSGKSTALRNVLFAPLGDLAYSGAEFSVLTDQREGRLFSDHYIVMFDEMSGAQKSDMERTKQMITSGQIKQRRMGTTSHDSIPMNATLFGSSNTPLESLVRDQTGMRRFGEFQTDPREDTSQRWHLLKEIDPKLLWSAVDGTSDESPIEHYMEELRTKQEALRDKGTIEWLISEGIFITTDNPEEFTLATTLKYAVSEAMGQSWGIKSLSKEWKRIGVEPHRTREGKKYPVKIMDQGIVNTLKGKYNIKITNGNPETHGF